MHPDQLLNEVRRCAENLAQIGRRHGGLFPSVLDRHSGRIPDELPDPIAGQRQGDRSHPGSNLIHDEALLFTMYALADVLDEPRHAEAADAYLARFATHCTDTATGLFPWGEHAFWNLKDDCVGDSHRVRDASRESRAVHDHLRQAPLWLWEKLHKFNPRCVERFAEGLDYHYKQGEPPEYTRHAHIEVCERMGRGERSCDFPRHGGFYIFDWAFAFSKSGREEFAEQIRRMLDYWWPLRDEDGLLLIESRTPEGERLYHMNAPSQTLSLAVSLLEAAPLLGQRLPQLAATMRERAAVYVDAFLAAPHRPDEGVFVILSSRDDPDNVKPMPIWQSLYGVWPASYMALVCTCGARLTGDERLLAWAQAAGRCYLSEPFPQDAHVPAMDAGMALGLLADLHEITGEPQWLEEGMALAEPLAGMYLDAELPRGASGIDWYESQMGPGFLLHGMARLALLARDGAPCALPPDYTGR